MANVDEQIARDMVDGRVAQLEQARTEGLITQENFYPFFYGLIDTQFDPNVTVWVLNNFRLSHAQAQKIVARLPHETTAETAAIFAKKIPLDALGHQNLLTVMVDALAYITGIVARDLDRGRLDLADIDARRFPLLYHIVRDGRQWLPETPSYPGESSESSESTLKIVGLPWAERELWLAAWYLDHYAKLHGTQAVDNELEETRDVSIPFARFLVRKYRETAAAGTRKRSSPQRRR